MDDLKQDFENWLLRMCPKCGVELLEKDASGFYVEPWVENWWQAYKAGAERQQNAEQTP